MAWFLTESKPCPWSTTAEALPQRSWRCPPEIVEVFYTLFQNGLHSGRLSSGSVVVFPATCSWCFLPPVPGISYHLFLVFPATCSWYFLPPVPGISCQFLVFPATCSWYFLPVPGIFQPAVFTVFPASCRVWLARSSIYTDAGTILPFSEVPQVSVRGP